MKGSKGYRRRSRRFRVKARDHGKISIRRYLQKFKEGDTVSISIDSHYRNIPHPRFQGKTGNVVGKQGRAYYIKIRNGRINKKILVTPEHLSLVRN